MTEAAANTKAALSVKDAQELLALQSSLLQPAAEKAAAYSRHVYEIAASTGAEVTRVAEATTAEAQAKFMSIVDTAVKNAPAGTENAVALVKSAVAAANNAFESVQKAAKQAAEVADANFQAMSSTAVRARRRRQARCRLSVEADREHASHQAAAARRPGSVRAFFCARDRER